MTRNQIFLSFLLPFALVLVQAPWIALRAQTPTASAGTAVETVRNRKDLLRLEGRPVRILGRYLPYSQASDDVAMRMEREFQEANPGSSIDMHRNLDAPPDWAGLLLEDGFFLLIFQAENAPSHRSALELKKLSGKNVAAHGIIHRGLGRGTVALADGHVLLDRLEIEVPPVVHQEADIRRENDHNVEVVGQYVLYSNIFSQFSEHMRRKFDQQSEDIHFRGNFTVPDNAPKDWAGLLLKDGSLVFLFDPDDPLAHRPANEWKKFSGRMVRAYGKIHEHRGEWGKNLLSYGYADAYLDLERIE